MGSPDKEHRPSKNEIYGCARSGWGTVSSGLGLSTEAWKEKGPESHFVKGLQGDK